MLTTEDAILRLVWAAFLGAVIGFERELTQKSAGLRTHILVCMGSAIFTLISVSDLIGDSVMAMQQLPPNVQVTITRDPGRIAAQIVTGIGFIGGGALLRYGNSVRGVTTAASLWMMASIGMLAGIGHYELSLVATLIMFMVLFSLGRLERSWFRKHLKPHSRMQLTVTVDGTYVEEVRRWVEHRFTRNVLEMHREAPTDQQTVNLVYLLDIEGYQYDWIKWREKLEARPGVRATGIKLYDAVGHAVTMAE